MSITRNAVDVATPPPRTTRAWSRTARQIGEAVAAVGEHHRQIADHAAGVMAAAALDAADATAHDSARVSPILSATSASNALPACETNPVSVRRDLYRETAPIAHHLQGDPPESILQAFSNPKNPCSGGQSSGPDHRGRCCFMTNPG